MNDSPENGDAGRSADVGPASASRLEIRLQLVTERLLLSALREEDAALEAATARRRAEFLADASLRLGESLDEELTYAVIAGLALPAFDAWCIVDVIEVGGGLRRLAVIHPDEGKRLVARALVSRWSPRATDPIGVPAVARDRKPVILTDGIDETTSVAAHDPETLRALRWLGIGQLLVVPIASHGELLGAITYVGSPGAPAYTPQDVLLGESLAERCAQAMVSARLYGAAQALWSEADLARAVAESAREEAEAANATKTHFLGTMSHELRTPLNAIGGYAELMEMGIYGPVTPEQEKALGSIQRSQHHLLGLIDGVLDYAKVAAGVTTYDLVSVPLHDLLAGCEVQMALQVRERQVTLHVVPSDRSVAARADPGKVQQVVLNLLSNAVKFTDPGGRITLATGSDGGGPEGGGRVTVRVEDTGRGIAVDELERIFQPFVQVDASLTRTKQGTGLGLAISRDLARGMGGELTVESRVGEGSTFTLTLPAA